MNKNQVIEAFNNHFMEFIKDIERVFPEDKDLVSTRKTINKTLVLMPKTLIRMFNDSFVNFYSNEIEEGDLNFFIKNDYKTRHGYKENDDPWILEKIDSLREPVRNMSDQDKLQVIKYLQNLKKLSDLYNGLRKQKI